MSIRTTNWVSKTDLTTYFRCPYAFFLLDQGLIEFKDTVNQQQVRQIAEGNAFQIHVEASAVPRAIEPSELNQVLADESIRLFNVPVFENPNHEIYGKPDAIDTAEGALLPVEIKSHKSVQQLDELELAFYWILLEPHRTKTVSPRGHLLLRRNGIEEQVEVEIHPHRFEQVHTLLKEIRNARVHGVPPRICGCTLCSGIKSNEIDRATLERKDLTRIWDIGRTRASLLEEIGIKTYDDLLAVDSATVVEQLRERESRVSSAQVDRWKHHATSYSTSAPVLFGEPLRLGGRFLGLDLEYEPGLLIWLVGVCLVEPSDCQYFTMWAETVAEEKNNLMRLAELVAANPSLPVITWNGTGADIPQLRNAVERLDFGHALKMIESRHLDLFQHAKKSLRLPIPGLGLGQVANYFAIPQVSRIDNGQQALSLYQEYQSSRDENRRKTIKNDLLEYNREDLEALVSVAKRIVDLQN